MFLFLEYKTIKVIFTSSIKLTTMFQKPFSSPAHPYNFFKVKYFLEMFLFSKPIHNIFHLERNCSPFKTKDK